jgi:D,D-heptose 1,7-bisphosphate phosphatase
MKKRAIFFDRDGTLMIDKDYLADPAQVELIPGAVTALQEAQQLGYLRLVVSNQSGVARGMITLEQVRAVNERFLEMLARENVTLEGLEFCPHHPDFTEPCECRKPGRGMVDRFRQRYEIDLGASYVIGDSHVDLALARNIGAGMILVETGYGSEVKQQLTAQQQPNFVAADVLAAIRWIAEHD